MTVGEEDTMDGKCYICSCDKNVTYPLLYQIVDFTLFLGFRGYLQR